MKQVKTKKSNRIGLKSDRLFYCLILLFPVLQFCVFYIGVNANSFALAFQDITQDSATLQYHTSWSLQAFKDAFELLKTPLMLNIIKTSFLAYFILTAVNVPVGLLFSYYIAKNFSGSRFFRVILFLPSILSSIVMATLYNYFFEQAVPAIVGDITGADSVLPLMARGDKMLFVMIMLYNLWIGFGVNVLMYANSMSGISPDILDAAKIDGATGIKEFWYVTLPLVFPTISVFLITGVAGIFTNQLNLFSFYGGRSDLGVQTFGYYLYRMTQASGKQQYPMLAAFGLMMTAVAVPLTFLVKYLLERFGPSED